MRRLNLKRTLAMITFLTAFLIIAPSYNAYCEESINNPDATQKKDGVLLGQALYKPDSEEIIKDIGNKSDNISENDDLYIESDLASNNDHEDSNEESEIMEYTIPVFNKVSGGTSSKIASASEASTGGFVTRMYEIVLGREPESDGYDYWVSELNSGAQSASDVVLGFFFSSEYQNKNKSNEKIVVDFYNAMLGREPDSEGMQYWIKYLEIGMTMRSIARGFVDSAEFIGLCNHYGINNGNIPLTTARDKNFERTYFVYRMYKNCLERDPDIEGLEYWCSRLNEGSAGSSLAHGFIFSREYVSRHTSNSEYTEMLYETILGRTYDDNGLNHWVELLDYKNTREHVLNGFLFSAEFGGQCATAGINIGDAVWEPDDTDEWQMNIRVLELCNNERESRGLYKLKTREDLWDSVAMVRARELPSYFSHTRPDGTSCYTAYSDAGVISYGYAENIAAGYSGASSVVNGWMNSTGHRANILTTQMHYLATGYCESSQGNYGTYYCQNFAKFYY